MALDAVPRRYDGIEVSETGSSLVVRIVGELDLASRDSIETAVMAAVVSAPSVILDLGELTFCDSIGVAMFIAVHEKATAEGSALAIRNTRPQVERVFDIVALDTVIRFID
jgi:anti-sigma B factor antagonist